VVYAADLRKNPENGYALYGLRDALTEQGRREDAMNVSNRYDQAWTDATHTLTSSRF